MTLNFINLSVLQHHPTQILDSVLNTNPGISEVIESFGIKHQEESKDKHLYSISLLSFFFSPLSMSLWRGSPTSTCTIGKAKTHQFF